jgi:Erv1 / Alr family
MSFMSQKDPKNWGPSFWRVLHVGSLNYPEKPSATFKERMKWFIQGIPLILPCNECYDNANGYISQNNRNMDMILSSRESLFRFFVDFHNYLNTRYGRKQYSYEEARGLWIKQNDRDPKIWGPHFWKILHIGSLHYPNNPSQEVQDRMKWFIRGIPVMLPCDECFDHANAHIIRQEPNLSVIASSKNNLFQFFVDFHNYVNKRHGKKQYTYDEAKRYWSQ